MTDEGRQEERYFCPFCPAGETNLTAMVLAERDEQMLVLRSSRRAKKWSVIVTCPKGHHVAFDGEWPTE